jgi:hypothetical protein
VAEETQLGDVFKPDPVKGIYIASFGPKGHGKSELNTRFFISYPFNGLIMDMTGDVDPDHKFSRPMTPALHELAQELAAMKRPSLEGLWAFQQKVKQEWTQNGELRYAKYRVRPNFINDNWLSESDGYIGLGYLVGWCFQLLDEINDEAPAGSTPRFTRLSLRQGRHEHLSMGMAGPRPADIDPNVLNQADLVTIHGQLHERDVKRMAPHLHLDERELLGLIEELKGFKRDGVDVYEYIVYVKKTRELFVMPPLPPRAPQWR